MHGLDARKLPRRGFTKGFMLLANANKRRLGAAGLKSEICVSKTSKRDGRIGSSRPAWCYVLYGFSLEKADRVRRLQPSSLFRQDVLDEIRVISVELVTEIGTADRKDVSVFFRGINVRSVYVE